MKLELELDIESILDLDVELPSHEVQDAIVELIEKYGYSFEEAKRIVREQ